MKNNNKLCLLILLLLSTFGSLVNGQQHDQYNILLVNQFDIGITGTKAASTNAILLKEPAFLKKYGGN